MGLEENDGIGGFRPYPIGDSTVRATCKNALLEIKSNIVTSQHLAWGRESFFI